MTNTKEEVEKPKRRGAGGRAQAPSRRTPKLGKNCRLFFTIKVLTIADDICTYKVNTLHGRLIYNAYQIWNSIGAIRRST
jgi:hypothetical protein